MGALAAAHDAAVIVRTLGKTKKTAYRWRDRFIEQGVDGLARGLAAGDAAAAVEAKDHLTAIELRRLHNADERNAIGLLFRERQHSAEQAGKLPLQLAA